MERYLDGQRVDAWNDGQVGDGCRDDGWADGWMDRRMDSRRKAGLGGRCPVPWFSLSPAEVHLVQQLESPAGC